MPLISQHEEENGSSQPPVVTDSGPVLYSSSSNLAAGPARYIKGELIGRGACKTVYRAFDEREGMEVAWNEISVNSDALTTLDDRARERIFGEIKLLKQLKHKNVLALYDWWYDKKNSNLIFITELLIDGSLRAYRRRHKNVDVSVLKRWGWQILQGLVYLHGHNPPIIHRDLKSDNIFVNGASGTLKIGDLGFATFKAGLSSAMSVIGTPEFMAPELYEEKYDEKVDIYSFGLCLLELATLEYPYCECRNAAQIFKKVTQGIPPQGLNRIADPELREFVLLCIRQDPKERPEARVLLKHPFFEAIRLDTIARSKLSLPSSANSTLTQPLPLALPASGLISPPGTRTPTPSVAVANGMLAAAAVVAGAQPQPAVAAVSHVEAATVQPTGAVTSTAVSAAVQRESNSTIGADSPVAPSVPAVMATLTAAAAVLAQRDSTTTLSKQPSSASLISAAPSSQPPGPSGRPSGMIPPMQGSTQAPSPVPSGRATQDDMAVAPPSVWPLDWAGQDSLDKGSIPQHDMRIAAAALTGSKLSRSSAGGAGAPAVQAASSSTIAATATTWQPNGHAPSAPSIQPHSPPSATRSITDKARQASTTSIHSAAGIGELTEDVLLYDDHSADGMSGRNSSAATAPGTGLPPAAVYPADSPFSASETFSPSTRLSLQRSKEYSLVVDDEDSEVGEEEEEEELACDPRLGQRVRLMCRNYQDNLLSFSMSFVNNNGTRKKVGFQYDMDADTAAEVAGEMIENLSLNHDEAGYIASLIQKELQRHQTAMAAAPPAAATTTITEITTAPLPGSHGSAAVGSAARAAQGQLQRSLSQHHQQHAAGNVPQTGSHQTVPPVSTQHWGDGLPGMDGRPVVGTSVATTTTTTFAPHTTSALTQGLQAAANSLRANAAAVPAILENAWPAGSNGQQPQSSDHSVVGLDGEAHRVHNALHAAQQQQQVDGHHTTNEDEADEVVEEEPSCFF